MFVIRVGCFEQAIGAEYDLAFRLPAEGVWHATQFFAIDDAEWQVGRREGGCNPAPAIEQEGFWVPPTQISPRRAASSKADGVTATKRPTAWIPSVADSVRSHDFLHRTIQFGHSVEQSASTGKDADGGSKAVPVASASKA